MNVIAKLDREAVVDAEGPMVLADLIEKEFGTPREELQWGVAHKLTWGEMTALPHAMKLFSKRHIECHMRFDEPMPQGGDRNVPVVMVHGATLTGKSWETTPDGRMGWDEYFVRKGHPVYVPDQVPSSADVFVPTRFSEASWVVIVTPSSGVMPSGP